MRITAKLKTKCSCGLWVKPESKIEWDKKTRKTVGCERCGFTGHPADTDPAVDNRVTPLDEFLYEEYARDRDWY